jgi:predicted 2-oxoglutarate/Fe(II)-dependent dioxygenase YbiX
VYLRNVVDKIIGAQEVIYSIHMIRYKQGDSCVKHIDRSSKHTYIFMLSDGFEGGELFIDGVNSHIGKGDVVSFNGQKQYHEVTEVISGVRDVLVVWTDNSIKELI